MFKGCSNVAVVHPPRCRHALRLSLFSHQPLDNHCKLFFQGGPPLSYPLCYHDSNNMEQQLTICRRNRPPGHLEVRQVFTLSRSFPPSFCPHSSAACLSIRLLAASHFPYILAVMRSTPIHQSTNPSVCRPLLFAFPHNSPANTPHTRLIHASYTVIHASYTVIHTNTRSYTLPPSPCLQVSAAFTRSRSGQTPALTRSSRGQASVKASQGGSRWVKPSQTRSPKNICYASKTLSPARNGSGRNLFTSWPPSGQ
jgi:hypothetical protein